MASGGSTPPSHLSLSQLSSNYLTSSSESLQTPNLSLTPVTNISVGNAGGNGSQSFTSLEELLNITGINAPDTRPSGVSGSNDNGVDSLHKMAQAVENAYQGITDLQPLPKKPRLDSTMHTTQQPGTSLSLPSNIRVQPLNNNFSSTKLQPDVTIASLLHKQFNVNRHTSVNSTATSLPVQSVKQVAPTVNSLTQKTATSSETRTENKASSGGIQATSKPYSRSLSTIPTQGSPQISASASKSTSTTVSVAQSSAGLQSTVSPVIPSLMQTPTTTPSSFSPKSFLLQLVQLYKHYQNLGDNDGMARVKKQLNVLVNTRQGLTGPQGSNPLLGALSLLTSPVSATGTSSTGSQTTQSNSFVSSTGLHTQGATASSLPLGTIANTTILNLLPNLTQQAVASQSQQESVLLARTSQSSSPAHNLLNSSIQSATLQPQQHTVTTTLPNSLPQAAPIQRTALPSSPQTTSMQRTVQSQRPMVTGTTVKTNGISTTPLKSVGGPSGVGNTSVKQSPTPPVSLSTTTGITGITPSQVATGAMQQELAIAVQQKAVKQLQTIMASLPISRRPKTVQEIRDFVHKYSSLINQIQTGTLPDLSVSSQSTKTPGATSSTSALSSSLLTTSLTGTSLVPTVSVSTATNKGDSNIKSTGASVGAAMHSIVVPINFGATSSSLSTQTASTVSTCSSIVTIPKATLSSSAMAQVDQHFQNSLSAVTMKSSLSTGKGLPTVALPLQQSTQSRVTKPVVVDLTRDSDTSTGTRTQQSSNLTQSLPGLAGTLHAPITTQFKGSSTVSKNQQQSNIVPSQGTATSSGVSSGIQAGVATPLPPGLTLETLAVLCRLPETELEKLKLPAGLLSAIKVWKDRQPTKKGASTVSKTSLNNSNRSNIPVLFPPSALSSTSSGHLSSIATIAKTSMKDSIFHNKPPMKVGDAISFASSLHAQDIISGASAGAKLTGDIQSSKKPYVIPSSVGFPPRSLHAYIPGIGQANLTTPTTKLRTTSSTPQRPTGTGRLGPQHMTRYRTKVDEERAQKDRIQALTKALQSSEEARIAFRFSAHLDKMHSQLLTPDTVTPFNSKQDVLARLLPYHVYAESEPPPAAVEKADAVFESVAQVLLSRSKGLRSRFQQMLAKSDIEGGGEMSSMQMGLGACFLEGEQERIQQEKLEKKQAEQVAADLSMMVKTDGGDTFDSEFSLSDAFFPFLDVDNGIT